MLITNGARTAVTTHWVREFAKAHHLQSSNTLQGGQSTTYIPTGAPGETWTHAFVHATALVHHEGFLPGAEWCTTTRVCGG